MLGIEVSAERLWRWFDYLAPDPQPFVVGGDDRWGRIADASGVLTQELRDTFRVWAAPKGSRLIWLTSDTFHALSKEDRTALVREQIHRRNGNHPGAGRVPSVREWSDVLDPALLRSEADGHRFVWWPDLVAMDPERILARIVSAGRLPSQHDAVDETTWAECAPALPGARRVAGTWAPLDEPSCCFSTVMEAAGTTTAGSCENAAVFDSWLRTACRPIGAADRPGTVLVWRFEGSPVHAAVCIGDGWTLEKPSQEWHSPRGVARTADVVRTSRAAGQRLERHLIK